MIGYLFLHASLSEYTRVGWIFMRLMSYDFLCCSFLQKKFDRKTNGVGNLAFRSDQDLNGILVHDTETDFNIEDSKLSQSIPVYMSPIFSLTPPSRIIYKIKAMYDCPRLVVRPMGRLESRLKGSSHIHAPVHQIFLTYIMIDSVEKNDVRSNRGHFG